MVSRFRDTGVGWRWLTYLLVFIAKMKLASEGYVRRIHGSYSSLWESCTISAHVTKTARLCNHITPNLDEYLYLSERVAVLQLSYKPPDPMEQSRLSSLFLQSVP